MKLAASVSSQVGISAPQGCGKTTIVGQLQEMFNAAGAAAASVSIDDYYLTVRKPSLAASLCCLSTAVILRASMIPAFRRCAHRPSTSPPSGHLSIPFPCILDAADLHLSSTSAFAPRRVWH